MPQSIVIQVGQAGNQIGKRFWDLALNEQSKHSVGSFDESLSTFFVNTGKTKAITSFKARGILIDMEEGVINVIKQSSLKELFSSNQYITSVSGSGNNWGQGYHQYGREYRTEILDSIRIQAEMCDSLNSIMMIQSVGGGTGSGLGSYISEAIRDELPEVWRFTTAVVPSQTDDVVTSSYNAILSLWKLTQSSDCVLPVDNQSLYSIYDSIAKASGLIKKMSAITDTQFQYTNIKSKTNTSIKRNEAFDTMNNIVANLMLNMTS